MDRARPALRAFVILVALWPLLPVSASGEVRDGLIDTFTIHKKKGIQGPVAVAYNALHEEYLAVWSDERESRVYGRRIRLHPHRGKVIRPKQLISSVADFPGRIALAHNPKQNTYLVVWIAFNQRSVWSVIVDPHGRPLGVGRKINEVPPEESCAIPLGPSVIYNGVEDSWLVVWQDNCFYGDGSRGRVVAGDGSSVGPIVRLHNRGLWPAVAFNPVRNEYLVVRQRGLKIKGQFHGSAGEDLGPQFVVAKRRPLGQRRPNVAWIPGTDRWLVVWRHGNAVSGAIIDALGILPPFVISEGRTVFSGFSSAASLSYSPTNRQMLVVWESNNDIESRWVDRIGKPRGEIQILREGLALRSVSPQALVCSQGRPRCLLAWQFAGSKSFFNDFDVFGGLLRVPAGTGW